MAAAAAKIPGQCGANFGHRCATVSIQQRFCRHDHAIAAIAALHRLLGNECLLQRMGRSFAANALDCYDFTTCGIAHWRPARTNRCAVHDDGASATLRESAAEFCTFEFTVIAQRIEQRRVAFQRDITLRSIDSQSPVFRPPGSSGKRLGL